MWAALGAYVAKMLALGIVIAVIPRDGLIDTRWLAAAVGGRPDRLARRTHALCLDKQDHVRLVPS